MYVYRHVTVERVIDGDTVALSIDLGARMTWRDSFRLFGIDTPERGQAGHDEATAYLVSLLAPGLSRIETFRPDKYGRYLADLFVLVDGGELHINKRMVLDGHAVEYFGGRKP